MTLVELLTVIAIIGLLISLLMPSVMAARESARKMYCSSNLRQITLAMKMFENQYGRYPSSWKQTKRLPNGTFDGWSAQAQILPFLELHDVHDEFEMDLSHQFAGDYQASIASRERLTSLRIPVYMCPSETNDRPMAQPNQEPIRYPLNYAVNLGIWYVHDECASRPGLGAFAPHYGLRTQHMTDGESYTIAFAEVKTHSPCFRNAGLMHPPQPQPKDIANMGGDFFVHGAHRQWVDGRVSETGFTGLFAPNTKVRYTHNGVEYDDVDWSNREEGTSHHIMTYAAITSRSHHVRGVNVSMMGGSVQFISNDIDLHVWRALITRGGGEVMTTPFGK